MKKNKENNVSWHNIKFGIFGLFFVLTVVIGIGGSVYAFSKLIKMLDWRIIADYLATILIAGSTIGLVVIILNYIGKPMKIIYNKVVRDE